MNRIFHILALMIIIYASASAGRINDYAFKIGDFEKIEVLDNVNVVYRCNPDSTGYVAYRGDEDFADAFIFTNSNGKLKVQVTTDDVNKPGLPVITVYSDFLIEAVNSSDFTLSVIAPAAAPSFEAKQIGNGKIVVEGLRCTKAKGRLDTGYGTVVMSGICSSLDISILGTGLIQADGLKAREVSCKILGSGTIGCWPTESLKVRGIGSTKIFYKGQPAEIKKSGGGKLIPLQSEHYGQDDILPEN